MLKRPVLHYLQRAHEDKRDYPGGFISRQYFLASYADSAKEVSTKGEDERYMPETNESGINNEEKKDIIEKCCAQLMEHFDTVQIFVTKHIGETGNTMSMDVGGGNWFARLGQVGSWMDKGVITEEVDGD